MDTFITFMRAWLSERSTWIGIFALLAAFNIGDLTEDQKLAIIAVGTSLVARHEQKSIR
jgi:hypothetical protein